MPRVCRATPGFVVTVAASPIPLPCVLDHPPTGIRITAVTCRDDANGAKTDILPSADGRSFLLPITKKGTFVVNVTLNEVSSQLVNVVEDCDSRTQVLAIADQGANFDLKVR